MTTCQLYLENVHYFLVNGHLDFSIAKFVISYRFEMQQPNKCNFREGSWPLVVLQGPATTRKRDGKLGMPMKRRAEYEPVG